MYKNILVPIDGSKLSEKAAKEAVGLARAVGAKLTLFHCVADFPAPVYAESAILAAQFTSGQYRKEAVRVAEEHLHVAWPIHQSEIASDLHVPHHGRDARIERMFCS